MQVGKIGRLSQRVHRLAQPARVLAQRVRIGELINDAGFHPGVATFCRLRLNRRRSNSAPYGCRQSRLLPAPPKSAISSCAPCDVEISARHTLARGGPEAQHRFAAPIWTKPSKAHNFALFFNRDSAAAPARASSSKKRPTTEFVEKAPRCEEGPVGIRSDKNTEQGPQVDQDQFDKGWATSTSGKKDETPR